MSQTSGILADKKYSENSTYEVAVFTNKRKSWTFDITVNRLIRCAHLARSLMVVLRETLKTVFSD